MSSCWELALTNLMATSQEMRNRVLSLQAALRTFTESSSRFRVLTTTASTTTFYAPVKTLYVLDSSFNPPTHAHLRIAISALLHDRHADSSPTKRLLLLLATQNADKAPKPASFEQRLAMMTVFAEELVDKMQSLSEDNSAQEGGAIVVDVGVTKNPLYLEKAAVLDHSGQYGDVDDGPEQVHLTGFDSLIRLLDPKYYPNHKLDSLQSLFEKHRVRATRRTDDQWGGVEEQDAYLQALANGEREVEGAKREWSSRIDLVDGKQEGEATISSTKVREASKNQDKPALEKLVPKGIADFILDQQLYA